MKKLIRFFDYSAGALLLITALAKFISSTGHSEILEMADPIFHMHYKVLMVAVGIVEVIVARMCLFDNRPWLRAGSVAWLVTHFLLYRLGLIWMHHLEPCPCLGTVTDVLPVSPHTIELFLRGALTYLAMGSFGSLLWLYKRRSKMPSTASISGVSSAA